MKLNQKLRNLAISTMFAGLIMKSYAANSIELMAGNNNTTLDMKTNAIVTNKFNIFTRNRVTANSENNVGYSGLIDFDYNIIKGLDAIFETQFGSGSALIPRVGVEYFKSIQDFCIFNAATIYLNKNSNFELTTNIRYDKKLNPNLGLIAGIENVVNFDNKKFNYGIQRIRTGLEVNKFEFGPALDLGESDRQVSKNIGVYAKVKF